MKRMDRVIYSQSKKDGELTATFNPILLYLDSSAWIDISEAYVVHKRRIIDEIATALGDSNFRILVSVINFLELIGTAGDISKNFSQEHLRAFDNVRMISANQPTIITDQEVYRFLEKATGGVRIFDSSQVALGKMSEGNKQRKQGNTAWFLEERKWWDERKERDRVLDLHADLWELSGSKPSPSEVSMLREQVLTGESIQQIRNMKAELVKIKNIHRGRKQIPQEKTEVLAYAANRITWSIERKYGGEKLRMLIANPLFVFPGEKNLIRQVMKDLRRGTQLTFQILKNELPGLYWQAKVTYYNYFLGYQSSGGQSGDRNHAVYIPYCTYFATCDRMLSRALESEHNTVYSKDNLRMFKIDETTAHDNRVQPTS
jgi:hypothetical protein